jgi:predicted O-methyltransferase YrrM
MSIEDKLDAAVAAKELNHHDYFRVIVPALKDGLILEFGVASGVTVNHIASLTDRPVYGFDSWEGLPEDWRHDYLKGAFAGELPAVRDNVTLIKGMFQDTLPQFLEEHTDPIALLHLDADLYSSTAYVLEQIESRLYSGSIVILDELWYPDHRYKDHEYKAFVEFIERTGFDFEHIGNRHAEAFAFRLI